MSTFFDPTPDDRRKLEEIARGIPEVQETLVKNHPQLTMPDRGVARGFSIDFLPKRGR